MEIKYINEEKYIHLNGCTISENLVTVTYPDATENLNGFVLYDNGEIIKNCSDFIYRWDVIDKRENEICYTNNPDYKQTELWPDLSNASEYTEPLSNEELTEVVADIMYEVSAAQLGV